MSTIEAETLLRHLDEQAALLSVEYTEHSSVIAEIQVRLRRVIGERVLESPDDCADLCLEMDEELNRILPARQSRKSTDTFWVGGVDLSYNDAQHIRKQVDRIRGQIEKIIQRVSGWEMERMNRIRQLAAQRSGKEIGVDPSTQTEEEILHAIPDSTKRALRHLVEEWQLDAGLIYQLLADLHPGRFRTADDEHVGLLSDELGKCSNLGKSFAIPDLPPEFLTRPDISWFREILFNARRDQLLSLFVKEGFHAVQEPIEEEIKEITAREKQEFIQAGTTEERQIVRQEYALKRQFAHALLRYFREVEELPVPHMLRTTIRGRQYPDRQQKVAAYETLRMGGRLFNGGKTGSGKTGSIIYTIAQGMEEGTFKKSLIQCPACILSEWRLALSDDPEHGYFQSGALEAGDVVFIDGPPDERPEQWDNAANAKIVVIGIELTRGSTLDIPHKDLLQDLNADFYAIDEAHRAKNTKKKAIINGDTSVRHSPFTEDELFENGMVIEHNGEAAIPRRTTTDMSNIYEVSRRSPYRVFASATVVSNTTDDLVAPTLCLNAEPDEYHSSAKPLPHRLICFERFLEESGLPQDRDILRTVTSTVPVERNFALTWEDIPSLRRDIALGGRECPRRFLPHFYRPPREACVPTPDYPPPKIIRFPLSVAEQGLNDDVRGEDRSVFEKMQALIRIASHPYAVSGHPETGSTMLRHATNILNEWFQNDVNHAVVVSPLFAQGMTRPGEHHPSASVFSFLEQMYAEQGVTVFALDGRESSHRVMKTPSSLSGRSLTKTQQIIERFALSPKGILVVQKDTIAVGLNEFARAGIGHVVSMGYSWTTSEMDQLFGRFPRPGQTSEVDINVLLAEGFVAKMHDQAVIKNGCNEIFLTGRIPTPEQLRMYHDKPSMQPISSLVKTPRQEFTELTRLMAGNGRKFIANGQNADRFVELYNANWEESYNGNVLRSVAGIAQARLRHMRSVTHNGQEKTMRIADDGAGTFGFHRTMTHVPNLDIHSSDLEPKMLAASFGETILGPQYKPENVHLGWAVDATEYETGSMDMRVTSLVLDCLAHSQRRGGKEMIKTFLESNRILARETAEQPGGEWTITLPTGVFKAQKRKLEQFLACFKYFGFEIIPAASGKVRCSEKDPDGDSFEVNVFTARRIGDPAIRHNTPWETLPRDIREGLDFRRARTKGEEKKKKKTSSAEENPVYYDSFVLESVDGPVHNVSYAGDTAADERKQQLKIRRELLRRSTPAVRLLLQRHATLESVPAEVWHTLTPDQIFLTDAVSDTPKAVRDIYMHAIIAECPDMSHAAEYLSGVNNGQTKAMIVDCHEAKGRYFVFAGPDGNPSGEKYYVLRKNGKKKPNGDQ